jgi:nucleoid-associated protein YgaU
MTVLQNSRSTNAKIVAVSAPAKTGIGYGQNLTAPWWAAHDAMYKPPPPAVLPPSFYVVRWGDDLYDIARHYNVPGGWPALYAFNKGVVGRNPNLIFPGQILHFPNYTAPTPKPKPKPKPKPPAKPPPKPTVYKPPPPRVTKPTPYSEYQVIEGDRLETLSYRNYGASIYWWVIADANPEMMHPEDDLTPGRIIRIPKQVASAFAALPRTPTLISGGPSGR